MQCRRHTFFRLSCASVGPPTTYVTEVDLRISDWGVKSVAQHGRGEGDLYLAAHDWLLSRTPIGKKGAQRQKEGPSDWRPVVGLKRESDQEGKTRRPNGAGTPRAPARRDKRQAGTQAGKRQRKGQAERRADGHAASRQASRGKLTKGLSAYVSPSV